MKILHVIPEFPYPPDAGCRADIWNRLRSVSRLGCGVDVLVMAQKRMPEERHVSEVRRIASSVEFVARRPLFMSLMTIVPTTVALNKTLARIQLREQYHLTLAESEKTFSIFDNPTLQTNMRVLRVHNNESRYMWSNAQTEEALLSRQFCRLEALRFVPFSRSAYRRVDFLWFISQSERENFISSRPASAAKAVWLPPAIEFGRQPQRYREKFKRVLWIASLNNALNREGLRWYLKEIHPVLTRDPGYELVVAGSTSGRACAHLFIKELQQQSRCSVHVDVSDLTALYNECTLFINPMRRGAGLKIKNIHAIERRVPVVTTSVGNDGSGFSDKEHVRVADTPTAFQSAVTELLHDESLCGQMADRAYEHLREHYDSQANLHRLLTTLLPNAPVRSASDETSLWRKESSQGVAERGVTRTYGRR